MKSGDSVVIRKSPYVTNLVSSPHRDYMEILERSWMGGSPTGTNNLYMLTELSIRNFAIIDEMKVSFAVVSM